MFDLPDLAVVEYDAIERATQRTVDFQEVGEFVRFVRDAHPLVLQPYLDATSLAMQSYPTTSPTYRWYRAQCVIIQDEMRQRRSGRVPYFMRPNVHREESLRQRRELVHKSVSLDYFIESVVGIRLVQRGNRFLCRCPYPDHEDSHPSFVIYPDGKGKCWSCHRYGDVFDVASAYWGMDRFVDVLKRLESLR